MSQSTKGRIAAPLRRWLAPLMITAAAGCAAPAAVAGIPLPLLADGTPSLAPMLEEVLPGVVNVVATGRVREQSHPLLDDPFFRHFFNAPRQPRYRQTQSIGSGVIIDARRGYVVTNHHVVESGSEYLVRLGDDREFPAQLIGVDPETDLAVVQIDAADLTAIPFPETDRLRVGDFVVAIGNPFGLRQTVTSGIVSALGRHGLGRGYEDYIQTDASINPGNSGGALVNLQGELVGINTMIYSNSGGSIGIGFAIPSSMVRSITSAIIADGRVIRPSLGVVGQDLTPELAQAFDLQSHDGVLVTRILDGSPADRAGLEPGDLIQQLGDVRLRDTQSLRRALGLASPGERMPLHYLRNGQRRTVTVTLVKPDLARLDGAELHPLLAGTWLTNMTEHHPQAGRAQGVIVEQVAPRSRAAQAGLAAGDIISQIGRAPVGSLADARKAAASRTHELVLRIQRDQRSAFIVLR